MNRAELQTHLGKKPRKDAEEQLQRAIVQHLKIRGNPDCIWFHPANGMPSSARMGARFKALGVVPGTPDLSFTLPDGRSAYMELKALGGRLSPEQRAFADKCARMGVEYCVIYNIDTAISVLTSWGVIKVDAY